MPSELTVDLPEFTLPQQLNRNELRCLFSLFDIDPKLANEYLTRRFDDIIVLSTDTVQCSLISRILCKALMCSGDNDFTEQSMSISHYDWDDGSHTNIGRFFANYDRIQSAECTREDLVALFAMDDGKLRQKVASCMQNVDGNILDRQRKKPHGIWEISDLEIEYTQNGKLYHLCMPFKSGREIGGTTVSESYLYQVIKPFTYFGTHCVVVFITAKKCSQSFENAVQRMRAQCPKWQIEIIQEEQLCKLLKLNGQL